MAVRFPIRAKLALALLIPIFAVLAVSLFEVSQATAARDQVQRDTDLAGAAVGPAGLIQSLEYEQGDAAAGIVGYRDQSVAPTENLAETRQMVDDARADFRDSLAQMGPKAAAVYAPALDVVDKQLAAARKAYDENAPDPDAEPGTIDSFPLSNRIYRGYDEPIDALMAANTRLTLLIDDPELRSAAMMLDTLSRAFEDFGRTTATTLTSSLSGGTAPGTKKSDVTALVEQFKMDLERIDLLATGPYKGAAQRAAALPAYQDVIAQAEHYVETGEVDVDTMIGASRVDPKQNIQAVGTLTGAALQDRSADLRDAAETRQRNFMVVALVTLLAGVGFTILAARSITRPLLSLTRQADEMATSTLPTAVQSILDTPLGEDVVVPDVPPIEVKTRDEVQQVASALNAVQLSALDLAVEQAMLRRNISDSFVNLGRRTQSLIARQLDFITDLERNETDAEALDNLFKLDHLATRARRNAESLVVLAGLVPPRTWTAPIAMSDVVRAALGEVEDYTRVEIKDVADAMVPGLVAADLVHLLAELLENGLSFSPPGRPVDVYGRMTRNGYVLAVIDQGMGMAPEEMAVANERLGGRESYTVAPSKYLGHYVAGILAQRLSAEVRLDESPTGGIAAKIVVPAHVLVHDDPVPAPEPAVPPAVNVDRTPVAAAPGRTGPEPSAPSTERSLTGLPRRSGPNPYSTTDPEPAPAAVPAPLTIAPPVPAETPVPVAANPAPPTTEPAPVAAALTAPAAASEAPGGWEPGALAAEDWQTAAARTTTANGLKKRVRGEGLATNAPRQIRRGQDADDAAPSRTSGSADGMFSLLSTFESGTERGREDFGKLLDEIGNPPDAAVPSHGEEDR